MQFEATAVMGADAPSSQQGKSGSTEVTAGPIPEPAPPVARTIKKGILSKRPRNKMGFLAGSWVLRSVELTSDGRLLYFDGKTPKGEAFLAGTVIDHLPLESDKGRGFVFRISNIPSVRRTQNSSLTLAAGSLQEADSWVKAITKAAVVSAPYAGDKYETLEEASGVPGKAFAPLEISLQKERRQKAYNEKEALLDNMYDSEDSD
ncbi:hypothetical protein B484DRAFT_424255 [Ochromonadaceae sp. CCMP2298]|nr:hypothetical protein B484DRAFT_424255 [Ochromonadaceae sp. CCMP2298]|mmetsp:Transcript_31720/g.69878  ORF Transcript_31720/g.69878 Transcript_31720/m.69878 type:complete len:205 (+) Transcript_31720:83-697(+)